MIDGIESAGAYLEKAKANRGRGSGLLSASKDLLMYLKKQILYFANNDDTDTASDADPEPRFAGQAKAASHRGG
jgi:hypothetical protein